MFSLQKTPNTTSNVESNEHAANYLLASSLANRPISSTRTDQPASATFTNPTSDQRHRFVRKIVLFEWRHFISRNLDVNRSTRLQQSLFVNVFTSFTVHRATASTHPSRWCSSQSNVWTRSVTTPSKGSSSPQSHRLLLLVLLNLLRKCQNQQRLLLLLHRQNKSKHQKRIAVFNATWVPDENNVAFFIGELHL